MEPLHEALRPVERQTALENDMRRPGGILGLLTHALLGRYSSQFWHLRLQIARFSC
jgi:hypothetical protein